MRKRKIGGREDEDGDVEERRRVGRCWSCRAQRSQQT
jgi:hypothetical protein